MYDYSSIYDKSYSLDKASNMFGHPISILAKSYYQLKYETSKYLFVAMSCCMQAIEDGYRSKQTIKLFTAILIRIKYYHHLIELCNMIQDDRWTFVDVSDKSEEKLLKQTYAAYNSSISTQLDEARDNEGDCLFPDLTHAIPMMLLLSTKANRKAGTAMFNAIVDSLNNGDAERIIEIKDIIKAHLDGQDTLSINYTQSKMVYSNIRKYKMSKTK